MNNFGNTPDLCTNASPGQAGWASNDFNRLTTCTGGTDKSNYGYGLGTLYDSQYDGNADSCRDTSTRPSCDAQMHTTHKHWGSGGGVGGLIGSDDKCNVSEFTTLRSPCVNNLILFAPS